MPPVHPFHGKERLGPDDCSLCAICGHAKVAHSPATGIGAYAPAWCSHCPPRWMGGLLRNHDFEPYDAVLRLGPKEAMSEKKYHCQGCEAATKAAEAAENLNWPLPELKLQWRYGYHGDRPYKHPFVQTDDPPYGSCDKMRCRSPKTNAQWIEYERDAEIAAIQASSRAMAKSFPFQQFEVGVETLPGGGRQSREKARFDLIPPESIQALAEVHAEGAAKHGEGNWRRIPVVRHLGRAMGHITQYLAGDRREPHLAHALCRVSMAFALSRGAKEPAEWRGQ